MTAHATLSTLPRYVVVVQTGWDPNAATPAPGPKLHQAVLLADALALSPWPEITRLRTALGNAIDLLDADSFDRREIDPLRAVLAAAVVSRPVPAPEPDTARSSNPFWGEARNVWFAGFDAAVAASDRPVPVDEPTWLCECGGRHPVGELCPDTDWAGPVVPVDDEPRTDADCQDGCEKHATCEITERDLQVEHLEHLEQQTLRLRGKLSAIAQTIGLPLGGGEDGYLLPAIEKLVADRDGAQQHRMRLREQDFAGTISTRGPAAHVHPDVVRFILTEAADQLAAESRA